MGQILLKPVCLCPYVRLCALSRSYFLMDFHQNLHRRTKETKLKTSSLGMNIAPPFPQFCSKLHFRRRGPQNIC